MKATVMSIVIAIILIGGALVFTGGSGGGGIGGLPSVDNVSIVNGRQIIEIRAKGGYQPKKSIARAGLPTVIRFNTSGTFDCSSSIRIPSLNISRALPQLGTTDIDIGSPKLGTIQGTCGMGMYSFEVVFQ